MNAPKWVIEKRVKICTTCEVNQNCDKKYYVIEDVSDCPLKKWANAAEEIRRRAWPESAQRVSGCCDSAINYGE